MSTITPITQAEVIAKLRKLQVTVNLDPDAPLDHGMLEDVDEQVGNILKLFGCTSWVIQRSNHVGVHIIGPQKKLVVIHHPSGLTHSSCLRLSTYLLNCLNQFEQDNDHS